MSRLPAVRWETKGSWGCRWEGCETQCSSSTHTTTPALDGLLSGPMAGISGTAMPPGSWSSLLLARQILLLYLSLLYISAISISLWGGALRHVIAAGFGAEMLVTDLKSNCLPH